jgi:hypothetical protein
MKKNIMSNLNTIATSTAAINALKNLFPEMDVETTFAEVASEWKKNRAKSEANAAAYAAAKEPVFAVLSDNPLTAKEIFEAAEEELPEGFSVNKIQWALLNLWNEEVGSKENGKNPKTYFLK